MVDRVVVHHGLWQGRFLDAAGVLSADKREGGVPVYLTLVANFASRQAQGRVSTTPATAYDLTSSIYTSGKVSVVVAASDIHESVQAPGGILERWSVRSPEAEAEGPVPLLDRLDAAVQLSLAREQGDPQQRGLNGFTLHEWNTVLADCTALVFDDAPPEGYRDRGAWLRARLFDLRPSTPTKVAAVPGTRALRLDGVSRYPHSVLDARANWTLSTETRDQLERVAWPFIRQRIEERVKATASVVGSTERARALIALVWGRQTWEDMHEALAALEEYDVWRITFPDYDSFEELDERWVGRRQLSWPLGDNYPVRSEAG